MRCYLCGSSQIEQIHDRCRDSQEVKVMRCASCDLVFLSDSRKISNDFYEASGMYDFHLPNRAVLMAEEQGDTDRRVALLKPLVKDRSYLDFGCGAGAVALSVKPLASRTSVVELNKVHREALLREGISAGKSLEELPGNFDIVTLFHVLEHLPDPISELSKIRGRLSTGGKIVVEVPHAKDALLSLYNLKEFKDFTYWSLHLFLFTEQTLKTTLEKAGYHDVEIRFEQRYPLANHLHWLSEKKPGGHIKWKNLSSPTLDAAYADRLQQLKATDTLIAIATS